MGGNINNPLSGFAYLFDQFWNFSTCQFPGHNIRLHDLSSRLRESLWIASSQHADCARIFLFHSAEQLAGLLVPGRSHSAGIKQADVCFTIRRYNFITSCTEKLSQDFCFILVYFTSNRHQSNARQKKASLTARYFLDNACISDQRCILHCTGGILPNSA